ncbi:MAG: class I SAM-dependent methyltransferase, partial [Gammaproteobacteria bacterium]|nr:class I SAM-dependent methyltransferase [Gammaproteobacteria bacterium]
EGPARFVPVRSSDNRIFTCFLEFRGDTIIVHDILHTRENGHWQLRVSCYQKLRLDYRRVITALRDNGMEVDTLPGENGMVVVNARKPS